MIGHERIAERIQVEEAQHGEECAGKKQQGGQRRPRPPPDRPKPGRQCQQPPSGNTYCHHAPESICQRG